MTLKAQLLARIATDGPITLADYMAEALLHPDFGYYSTRDPLGADGDFTTSPEISQMFGELIGLSLAQTWLNQGGKTPFTLLELGPGRGTLMQDALRAAQSAVPAFQPDLYLLEASAALRAVQADTLTNANPTWIETLDQLPDQPTLVIANEFFDALPIRQFARTGNAWREVHVSAQDGKLTKGLGPQTIIPTLDHRLQDTTDGDIVEICPSAKALLDPITHRIARHGGAALIIDYGDWRALGDTVQALQNHRSVDPLADPGHADLTAHVDFEALATAAHPAKFTRVTPQGIFLERLGITERAQILARNLHGAALESHIAAHRRLTHPEEMGNLFKVMGLYPPDQSPPPGLEP